MQAVEMSVLKESTSNFAAGPEHGGVQRLVAAV